MRGYRRFSTVGQMAGSVGVFVALVLLLESGGLVDWAQRLELGPERSVALPVVTVLHRGVARFGMEHARQRILTALARVGWSDDAAAVEDAAAVAQLKPAAIAAPVGAGSAAASTTAKPHDANADVPEPTTRRPLPPMQGAPPLLSVLPPFPAVPAGGTRTVALAGDSMMAVGLSSTILRQAPKYKDLTLLKAFKSGTGLARPEVFNWQTEYPAMLHGARPDVVVVAIGANDGQGFVSEGVTYPFGSEGWKEIYQRRVEAFLEMLEADGASVVWVGLPPMKSDAYDARIALVNRIDYAVVSASPKAIWFSSAGLVGDAQGRFQDFGEVHGATTRLRQADGIHLTDDGATLLVARLLPWLAAQESAPSVAPAVTGATASADAKP
jgi:hypothetical protein